MSLKSANWDILLQVQEAGYPWCELRDTAGQDSGHQGVHSCSWCPHDDGIHSSPGLHT